MQLSLQVHVEPQPPFRETVEIRDERGNLLLCWPPVKEVSFTKEYAFAREFVRMMNERLTPHD